MDSYTVPDYKSAALITIDVQCDTLDGQPLEIPGTSAMLPRLTALLGAARSRGMPIVHMVRIYKADGSNADVCRRAALEKGAALLLKGSAGCALAPELLPAPAVKLDPELLLAVVFRRSATTKS